MRFAAVLWIWFLLAAVLPAHSAPRPTVTVGMTAALSGPARSLGQNMRLGVEAAFAEGNLSQPACAVRLAARDDGYDPAAAAANAKALIEDEQVVALLGSVGTPTALVTAALAQERRVLFFAPLTGAALVRPKPDSRYLIHVRASYAEETALMVKELLAAGLKAQDIAFFTQDDAFGDDGFSGALQALKSHDPAAADHVLHVRYARNTVAVEGAVVELLKARRAPRAIVMVAANRPAAAFIDLARQLFPKTLFLALSFVDGQALAARLDPGMEGVIVSQVVPPSGQWPPQETVQAESAPPILDAFRQALQLMSQQGGQAFNLPEVAASAVALEGYLAGRMFLLGLERAADCTDRESVIDGLLSLGAFDVGLGVPLYLGPASHQASHTVWPSYIAGGAVHPMTWQDLGRWVH
jgi:branched-chain amino acid transport system substrate-binding protein